MTRPSNKVTLRDIDNVLLGGAVQGIGEVVGGLLGAAGERATTYAVYGVSGAITGYGTEWQRVVAMNSKYRPTTKGQVVGGAVDHPANVITYGDAVTVTLRGTNPQVVNAIDGEVFGWDDDGLELEDGAGYFAWDEMETLEVNGATVWSCYSGDERRDYQVGRG